MDFQCLYIWGCVKAYSTLISMIVMISYDLFIAIIKISTDHKNHNNQCAISFLALFTQSQIYYVQASSSAFTNS